MSATTRSTYPLHELRALIAPAGPIAGIVVAVGSTLVDCATATGLRQARPAGRTLKTGERVSIRDGLAYPAATAARRYHL